MGKDIFSDSQNPSSRCKFFMKHRNDTLYFTSSKEELLSYISHLIQIQEQASIQKNILIEFFISENKTVRIIDKAVQNEENETNLRETPSEKDSKDAKKDETTFSDSMTHEKEKKDEYDKTNDNKKNCLLNNKKNCLLNNKKNCLLNNNRSPFIDLTKLQPQHSTKAHDFQQTFLMSYELQLLFQRDQTYLQKLMDLMKKYEMKHEFIQDGLNISCSEWKNLQNFILELNSLMLSLKVFKVKKNQEELPGIIDFFHSQSLSGVKLQYHKYIENFTKKKVDICIYASVENEAKAKELCSDFEKFYFKKEIMIYHYQNKPLDLKNYDEFQQIQEEGSLMNLLIAKLIKNRDLSIDSRLNYQFIDVEQKSKSKNPKFPNSMLFYWKKEHLRSEFKGLIQEIKAKLKEFAYISLYFKNNFSLQNLQKIKEQLNGNREKIVISEPKLIKENSLISISIVGKWYSIKETVDCKLIPAIKRKNIKIEILGISFNKGKLEIGERDEDYQFKISALVKMSRIDYQKRSEFVEFESENYIVYRTLNQSVAK